MGVDALVEFLRGKITFIEGNMCAAKSTLCKAIKEHFHDSELQVHVFFEGFDAELLAKFNENPHKYAAALQLDQQRRCDEIIRKAREALVASNYQCACIIDRGRLGNAAFAAVHRSNGNMSERAFREYLERYASAPAPKVLSQLECNLFTQDGANYVFIEVEPTVAYERCKTVRKRAEESNNQLAYFEQLERQHERYRNLVSDSTRVVLFENNLPLVRPKDELFELFIKAVRT